MEYRKRAQDEIKQREVEEERRLVRSIYGHIDLNYNFRKKTLNGKQNKLVKNKSGETKKSRDSIHIERIIIIGL
jgi:hypothetical protein